MKLCFYPNMQVGVPASQHSYLNIGVKAKLLKEKALKWYFNITNTPL